MDTLMGRYRNVSILAAAVFIQLIGLAVQVKRSADNQSTRLIRMWAVSAVTPLEKGIVRLHIGARELWHNYFYLRGVRQQNRQLQEEIQQLQLERVRLKQDADQAHRLQALLGFKEQFIDQTVAAQVIGSSGSEQSRIVYLDKGADDGIAPGMAVISADGIVGKVLQVYGNTSQVLLVNDQTSGVGAILEQSRLQGVLKGKASGEVVIDNIMAEEDVKVGERVLTSGGDQIFPKGLPVGTVASVTPGKDFLQVKVRPAAALNHLEEVLVITRKVARQPQVLSETPQRAADILAQRLPSVPDKPAADGAVPSSGAHAGAMAGATPVSPKPAAAGAPRQTTSPAAAAGPVRPQANQGAGTSIPPGAKAGSGTVAPPPAAAPQSEPVKAAVPPASKAASNPASAPPQPPTPGGTPQ